MERRSFFKRAVATLSASFAFFAPTKVNHHLSRMRIVDRVEADGTLGGFLAEVLRHIRVPEGSRYLDITRVCGDVVKVGWDGTGPLPGLFTKKESLTYEEGQQLSDDWRKFTDEHTLSVVMDKHLHVSFLTHYREGEKNVEVKEPVGSLSCEDGFTLHSVGHRRLNQPTAIEVAGVVNAELAKQAVLSVRLPWIPPVFGVECFVGYAPKGIVSGRCGRSFYYESSWSVRSLEKRRIDFKAGRKVDFSRQGTLVTFDLICGTL